MAKSGIEYYARDVNLMRDRKFNRARQKYGYLVYVIYDALLEMIYSDKGYYLEYSEDTKEDVLWELQDYCRGKYVVESALIDEVIGMLVACELFSGDHFTQGIITSRRIQETYYRATVERHTISVDPDIWMLTFPEMEAISGRSFLLQNLKSDRDPTETRPKNGKIRPKNTKIRPSSEQSKVKESKVKESIHICSADAERCVEAWNTMVAENSICGNLPAVTKLMPNTDRYRNLQARLKEYGLEKVLKAIGMVKDSKFLCGAKSDRGWKADFGWLMKPNNFIKVLEGNYTDTAPEKPQAEQFGVKI